MKLLCAHIFLLLLPSAYLASQGYVAALGGGSVPDNVFQWIVDKSGNGTIIILNDRDASDYLPNLFISLGATHAYNFTIDSRSTADLQSTYDAITSADAVYIRGGDQWVYVRDWKNTKTEEAITNVFTNGGVVAGTSAGAAVLGEFVFTAQYGTVLPGQALRNPLARELALDDQFLNLVPGVLFDTHFIERGRFGRLLPFLVKIYVQRGRNILGVGLDDGTALCIYPDGVAEVKGTGAVAFYNMTPSTRIVSSPFGYTIENVVVDQLVEGWKYDIPGRQIYYIPESGKPVESDRPWMLPKTSLWFSSRDDMSFVIPNLVQRFHDEHDLSNVLLITCTAEYLHELQPLKDYFDEHNVMYSHLSADSLEEEDAISKIELATTIIFAGRHLEFLTAAFQPGSQTVQALQNRIAYHHVPVVFLGNVGKLAGGIYVNNVDEDDWAAFLGKMTLHQGLGLFHDLVFQPLLFEDSSFYENRTAAVLWGLMRSRMRLGLYLNTEEVILYDHETSTLRRFGDFPFVIVDARYSEYVDSSKYRLRGSPETRQAVAMTNLRYHVSTTESYYNVDTGSFGETSFAHEDHVIAIPETFTVYQNYPNPFNDQTIIRFYLPQEESVRIVVYNVLGQEITTLLREEKPPGFHEVLFRSTDFGLGSGVYFYTITAGNRTAAHKMVYLR